MSCECFFELMWFIDMKLLDHLFNRGSAFVWPTEPGGAWPASSGRQWRPGPELRTTGRDLGWGSCILQYFTLKTKKHWSRINPKGWARSKFSFFSNEQRQRQEKSIFAVSYLLSDDASMDRLILNEGSPSEVLRSWIFGCKHAWSLVGYWPPTKVDLSYRLLGRRVF